MDMPVIKTALPRQRYQLGEFTLTILGDIESGDGINYHYLMGVVREGEPRPFLYVSSERNTRAEAQAEGGSHRLRMITQDRSQLIGSSDEWRDLDRFAEQAIMLVARLLNVLDEMPVRLS